MSGAPDERNPAEAGPGSRGEHTGDGAQGHDSTADALSTWCPFCDAPAELPDCETCGASVVAPDTEPVRYALAYAALGWRVFPVYWITDDGACACGQPCHSPGKHPLTRNGVHDATSDAAQIRRWWRQHPRANVAVATGADSGIWVLDVDTADGKAGDVHLEALTDAHGELPDTAMAFTGSGGRHYVFRYPEDGRISSAQNKPARALDVRGDGGYIVAPPSRHVSGGVYEWEASSDPTEGAPIVPAPDYLVERVATAGDTATPEAAPAAPIAGKVTLSPAEEAELRSALAVLPVDGDDGNGDRDGWLRVGQALHADMDSGQAFTLWRWWSSLSAYYNEPELRRVWASFHDEGNAGGEKLTLASIYHWAQGRGWVNPQSNFAAAARDAETKDSGGFRLIRAADLEYRPPQWIIRDLLEADSLAVVFGDPGCGKSFLALDVACSVSTGVPWHGRRVAAAPVIYLAGEGHNGIRRRLSAWERHNGETIDEAPLYVSAAAAELCNHASVLNVVMAVDEVAKTHGAPGVVVIDTLARNFGPGDENATEDMTAFIKAADTIRTRYACTVLLIHHTGHGDKTRARGAMALKGAIDAEYRMDRDESGVVRVEPLKMKDAPLPDSIAFQLESIPLGLHDDEGREVTSAVLTDTSYEAPASSGGKAGRGKWQNKALELLNELYYRHRENVARDGRDPDTARVAVEHWREACRDAGMSRQRWNEIRQSLPVQGLIRIEHGFVRPSCPNDRPSVRFLKETGRDGRSEPDGDDGKRTVTGRKTGRNRTGEEAA